MGNELMIKDCIEFWFGPQWQRRTFQQSVFADTGRDGRPDGRTIEAGRTKADKFYQYLQAENEHLTKLGFLEAK